MQAADSFALFWPCSFRCMCCNQKSSSMEDLYCRYEPHQFTEHEGLDWPRAWAWAEDHPEAVAEVVREANKFAQLHLTKKGKTCYMARAMMHYAKLMTDRGKVKQLWERTVKDFPFGDQYGHLIADDP